MALLTAIPRNPNKGAGGVDYFYLANLDDVSVNLDPSTGVATFDNSIGTAFVKIFPKKETGNAQAVATGSAQTGTTMYAHTITIQLSKNSASQRNLVAALGTSEVVAIAKDMNGAFWLYGGETRGLDMTANTGQLGAAMTDLNGQTITLSGNLPHPEYSIDVSSLSDLGES